MNYRQQARPESVEAVMRFRQASPHQNARGVYTQMKCTRALRL